MFELYHVAILLGQNTYALVARAVSLLVRIEVNHGAMVAYLSSARNAFDYDRGDRPKKWRHRWFSN